MGVQPNGSRSNQFNPFKSNNTRSTTNSIKAASGTELFRSNNPNTNQQPQYGNNSGNSRRDSNGNSSSPPSSPSYHGQIVDNGHSSGSGKTHFVGRNSVTNNTNNVSNNPSSPSSSSSHGGSNLRSVNGGAGGRKVNSNSKSNNSNNHNFNDPPPSPPPPNRQSSIKKNGAAGGGDIILRRTNKNNLDNNNNNNDDNDDYYDANSGTSNNNNNAVYVGGGGGGGPRNKKPSSSSYTPSPAASASPKSSANNNNNTNNTNNNNNNQLSNFITQVQAVPAYMKKYEISAMIENLMDHNIDPDELPYTNQNGLAFLIHTRFPKAMKCSQPFLPPKLPQDKHKDTLVLDLDETLMHCSTQPIKRKPDMRVNFSGPNQHANVHFRPYVHMFLEMAAQDYELIIFTASTQPYADQVLNRLDPSGEWIRHRLYRPHCTEVNGGYVKDLRLLGRDLSRTILADNSLISLGFQLDNSICVSSWFGDDSDKELVYMLQMLQDMREYENFQEYLVERYSLREWINTMRPPHDQF